MPRPPHASEGVAATAEGARVPTTAWQRRGHRALSRSRRRSGARARAHAQRSERREGCKNREREGERESWLEDARNEARERWRCPQNSGPSSCADGASTLTQPRDRAHRGSARANMHDERGGGKRRRARRRHLPSSRPPTTVSPPRAPRLRRKGRRSGHRRSGLCRPTLLRGLATARGARAGVGHGALTARRRSAAGRRARRRSTRDAGAVSRRGAACGRTRSTGRKEAGKEGAEMSRSTKERAARRSLAR